MTVVEATACIGDANHGFVQNFATIAHGSSVRAPEIQAEIHVAVIGQSSGEPTLLFSHRVFPSEGGGLYCNGLMNGDGSHPCSSGDFMKFISRLCRAGWRTAGGRTE